MSAIEINWKLSGLAGIKAKLDSLGPKMATSVERKAFRKVCAELRTAIRGEAPRESGTLARSVRTSIKRPKRSQGVLAQVVVGAPHAHLVEFGHMMVTHKPNKRVVGRVAPRKFIRKVWDSRADRAYAEVIGALESQLAMV